MVQRPHSEQSDRLVYLQALALATLALLAYLPVLHAGFIWDDDRFLTANPLIRASDGLKGFWFSTAAPDYWPVTSTSLWLEWRLWGANPLGYHVTNLLLHGLTVLLVWRILRRLGMPGAFVAAALFAVHPLNAESVVWITQRKNLMAMIFGLVSVDSFLRERRILSLVAFVLAMLSKGSSAFIPVVLLGVVVSQGASRRREWIWLLAFFLVDSGFTAVNVWFQAIHYLPRHLAFLTRLMYAGDSWGFYLGKAFLPFGLAFVYPQWRLSPYSFFSWLPLAGLLAVSGLLISRRKTILRPLLFAWAYFAVALIPVLGIADTAFMIHAPVSNHYSHFALIGAVAAVGWAVGSVWNTSGVPAVRWGLVVGVVGIIAACSVLTWRQAIVFGDALTLYQDSLVTNPDSWMVQNNLGVVLSDRGDTVGAEAHFIEAIRLKEDFGEAHFNFANSLSKKGDFGRALVEYQRAGELSAGNPQFRDRAQSLVSEGREALDRGAFDTARMRFEAAIALDPLNSSDAECDLGLAWVQMKRPEEAVGHFETAVRIAPESAVARNDLGNIYLVLGRNEDAVAQLQAALRLRPDDRRAHYNLSVALRRAGRNEEARSELELARP